MSPRAVVRHRLPGRARLRIAEERGDTAYFSSLANWLMGLDGVRVVRADPRTGGVLILHPQRSLEDLRDRAREERWFRLEDLDEAPIPGLRGVEDRLRFIDQGLSRISRGEIDLRAVLFLVLVGLAGRQVWNGQVMVPAVTLLWYARDLLGDKALGRS